MIVVHAILLTAAATASSWTMSGSTTVIVGLNGALQKRLILSPGSTLVPGDVHRAGKVQVGVGGKGQDVAIALSCLFQQSPDDIQLAQFVGSGPEGDQVYQMLQDMIGKDAMRLTVRPASHMRTCTTIVASDTSTELVEPSGTITRDEQDQLMARLDNDGRAAAGALCIMGSMPPGCPPEMYAGIYERVHGENTLCLIDSVVGLEPLLKTIASSKTRGPAVLKVNASELCRLAKIQKTSSEIGGINQDELVEAVHGFLDEFQPFAIEALSGFAITDGRHPAHYIMIDRQKDEFEIIRIPTPNLESVETLYPIGAGDTVAATTLAAWRYLEDSNMGKSTSSLSQEVESTLKDRAESVATKGLSSQATLQLSAALAFGTACGSASCLKEENSQFDVTDALRLLEGTSNAAFVSRHSITGKKRAVSGEPA